MKILLFHSKKFPITEEAQNIIDNEFKGQKFVVVNSRNTLFQELPDTDIFLTGVFTQEMADTAKKLKWVNALSAGVDNYDLELFKKNNILFTNSTGIHKTQMSEYAIMSMVMLVRNMNFFIRNQHANIWNPEITQSQISGKTVGILGLGSIGKETAEKAAFMGMKVIGINTSGINRDNFIEKVYTLKEVDSVIKNSDFLINLLPSTAETKYLLTSEKMRLMKKNAYFINMGRGNIISNETLYEVLKDNIIAGAVCDVFESEPLPEDSPLWKLENLIITPHICGNSDTYIAKALRVFSDNFQNFISNKKMFNIIV
ncbi:D-2-hydroxyacid dehydrogenase [Sebaldella sp. S0638]|uniref:D-2-hydroxyacid dehydrogenase n=1 Tax=Sebaldella sp. S0638 TaxID=2957809 RepID=UPI0020A1EA04|nr:D-2-hydroxyacid dehydrogenase [Sebaldella sp. S0638]MCP1223876.1 D-2-hydroxyacid dehydrogenase [Sebaldella sp. S0638]